MPFPTTRVSLDLGNEIAALLVGFWYVVGDELVSAIPTVDDFTIDNAVFADIAEGRVVRSSSAGVQTAHIAQDSAFEPTDAMTFLVWVEANAGSTDYLFGCEVSPGGYGAYTSGTTYRPYCKLTTGFADPGSTFVRADGGQIGFTFDKGAIDGTSSFYTVKNGAVDQGSADFGVGQEVIYGSAGLALTNISAGGDRPGSGGFLYVAIANARLSDAQLSSFYADPSQVLSSGSAFQAAWTRNSNSVL